MGDGDNDNSDSDDFELNDIDVYEEDTKLVEKMAILNSYTS